jgi:hypothetical protein
MTSVAHGDGLLYPVPRVVIPASVLRALFSATVFFYPFSFAWRLLYLLPQGILIVLLAASLWQRRVDPEADQRVAVMCLAGFAATLSAGMVEFLAHTPNYDLVVKLAINSTTVCLAAAAQIVLFSRDTIRSLCWCAAVWAFGALAAYAAAGTSPVELYLLFSSGEGVDSSTLYGIASPLENVYLTKNISAMFVASVFSFFLYLKLVYEERLRYWEIALFLLAMLVFASRQAIVAFVGLLMVYRLLQGLTWQAMVLILCGVLTGVAFFLLFFDLQSSGDGASQRLELWTFFLKNTGNFAIEGYGLDEMNRVLERNVGIDNFHMFFMNQIGAYGFMHFTYFSAMCLAVLSGALRSRVCWLLVAGYYLNVTFQTYGYEYGNLFLFVALVSRDIRSVPDTWSLKKVDKWTP